MVSVSVSGFLFSLSPISNSQYRQFRPYRKYATDINDIVELISYRDLKTRHDITDTYQNWSIFETMILSLFRIFATETTYGSNSM